MEFRPLEQIERVTLRNKIGLLFDLYPNGAVCAIRHGPTLINQIIGVPPEGAPFRLWLQEGADAVSLVGPATAQRFGLVDERHALWQGRWHDLEWSVQLALDNNDTAWSWHTLVHNRSDRPRPVRVLLAQDLGLASKKGVRLNEAYTSHYIDHAVAPHPAWGPVIFSRQNISQAGTHPWIAHACPSGADAYATDGMDVFGTEQRAYGIPRALANNGLPSTRRQGESACAALQSRIRELAPDQEGDFAFVATYLADHPGVSSAADLKQLMPPEPYRPDHAQHAPTASIWDAPPLLHGMVPDRAQWDRLYPTRKHEEWNDGALWSFFTEDGRHVVSGLKETVQERSNGHILCGSSSLLPDAHALGTTVYAAGVFNAQTYLENPNMVRLLTVIRDPLQRARGAGQRIWVDAGKGWQLLGIPTLFEMGLNHALWRYEWDKHTLEIRTDTQSEPSAVNLQARVIKGPALRWKITHQLALDANELDSAGAMTIHDDEKEILFTPSPETVAAQRCPDMQFRVRVGPPDRIARMGGDELVWADGASRGAPYMVIETNSTKSVDVCMDALPQGEASDKTGTQPVTLPALNWRITDGSPEVMPLADILPWFRHDAWIHLAAPHGLEQYGGAAWGVRDVCQGALEWLITEQRYDEIRAILHTVFSHQYEEDSLWPQWFMLGRYADWQQRHCHGDIMFWPLKALCDYAEAANDPGILDMEAPFTCANSFQPVGRPVPLRVHVDRVIDAYRKQCIPGTTLVAYGDGDWDDTLQPVQPEMRRNMVSAWTVELAYQVFGQLENLFRRANRDREAAGLSDLREQIRSDFMTHLMPDGIVAGFGVFHDQRAEPRLHPRDTSSGIRYRLLPMTRGILSGLFDNEQVRTHCDIIRAHLRFPDGVRLMDRPVRYTGGISTQFQRAETAAYFGREVSLQYVHAHLRYAEAMARIGDADETWWALQTVNPLGLSERLSNALPRQANVYFSSSDADFPDRYEADVRFEDLRNGAVGVRAGWRLYSSGPGLYLHKVRCALLGIREYYNEIHWDPMLPAVADGLTVALNHEGADTTIRYVNADESVLRINGRDVATRPHTADPYRCRGMILDRQTYRQALSKKFNQVEVHTPSLCPAPVLNTMA